MMEKLMQSVLKLTQSMWEWLEREHPDKIALILLGHTELFTEKMARDYIKWCRTEEGRRYLKGGNEYDPEHPGNIACDRAWAEAEGGCKCAEK